MSGFFTLLSIISFIVLLIGIIVWFIRRKTTNRLFSRRSKKIMWFSLAIYFISLVGGGALADQSETAEIQPLVQAEVVEKNAEEEAALAEAEESEAEEARLAKEKEEAERIAAEKKVAEAKAVEQAAADQKAAEEKAAAEQLALEQKAAEEKATAERLALEQKAAEEKAAQERIAAEQSSQKAAASTAASSESFQNCTELRKVYPSGVPKGHAAYESKMDRDKDDFACEA